MLTAVVLILLYVQCAVTVTVTKDEYGKLGDQTVYRYTFCNINNVTVEIITYGGRIAAVKVPDRNGNVQDVMLGFDNLEGFVQKNDPYFGAVLGRVANRIGGATFKIDGVQYHVTPNEGRNQLHGGLKGFDKVVWESYLYGNDLILSYVSKDGEEGFPGAVLVNVIYTLTDNNNLVFAVQASTTKPTPINIANHAYFNLAGQASGPEGLFEHVLTVNADRFTETNNESIPTGQLHPVEGTDLDFRVPRQLGPLIKQRGGYDNNFAVNQFGSEYPVFVARADHPQSGRFLEVWSNQPGVQVYTGNGLPKPDSKDPLIGKGGVSYQQYGSLSLETQDYPDAVNHPNFPNSVLRPGGEYSYATIYKFGVTEDPPARENHRHKWRNGNKGHYHHH